ncbi:MAG: hypothetical protein NTZ73_03575 [Candidatus Diapherotrites archaeon]|nr:hypothetical protein [Candidatus Diapherotrites archaeon]
MVFEVGIGTSQNWDAEKASLEATTDALSKLTHPPTFVLLFSTIHYEKNNGFQKILDTTYTKIPKETPLVGGTTPGFMTNAGVFTKGIVVFLLYSDEINVTAACANGTKRNPKSAAKKLSEILSRSQSGKKNNLILEFVNGPTVPQFPWIKGKKILKNVAIGTLFKHTADIFLSIFQNGVGREEEILAELANKNPDVYILGGSTLDNNELGPNFQFFNKKVLTNNIVALSIKTDNKLRINTTYALQKTGIKFKVKKAKNNERIIEKLNDKNAKQEFLARIGWNENILDERLYRKTFHYAIGYEKDKITYPEIIGAFYGNDIWTGYKFDSDEAEMLVSNGKTLMAAIDENIASIGNKKLSFNLFVACASILETLGKKNYFIKEKMDAIFKNDEYLMLFLGGEDSYSMEHGIRHLNYSFNSISMS